ncbi:MAG: hypothetical protein NTZ94_16685 [Verrucomicrobia bacterium]|nr:hypothetical protein [Verrucomicrobiota bacterium]
MLITTIPLEVSSILPEPIPPGLTPSVDVSWSILPYRETADAFGRKVASQYFAVNIRLGNNSAYPIQLAGFGFDLNNLLRSNNGRNQPPAPSPNSPYHVTRSTIERDREVGARAIFLNGLTAALNVYSVAGGFFGTGQGGLGNAANAAAKDRYALFLALGNPLAAGFGLIVPDKTIRHLIAMDTRAFRDNQIISNNTHQQILTFISRDLVECRKMCQDLTDPAGWKGTLKRIPYKVRNFDPNAIKVALGNLVITVAAPPVVTTPKLIEITQGAANEEIAITGNSLVGVTAAPVNRTDVKVIMAEINSDGSAAKIKFDVGDDAAPGDFLLQIARPNDPAWTLPVKILPAVPTVVPPVAVPIIDQTATVNVNLTGRFLKGAKCISAEAKVKCEPTDGADGKAAVLAVRPAYDAPIGNIELTIERNGKKGDKTVSIKVDGGKPIFTPDPSKASIKTTPITEKITMKLTAGEFLATSELVADGALRSHVKITPIGSPTGKRGEEVAEYQIEFLTKPTVGAYSFSVKNGSKSTSIPFGIVQ